MGDQNDGRVMFLEVVLPRLKLIQRDVDILGETSNTSTQRQDAARRVVADLCSCYQAFSAIDLSDVVGNRSARINRPKDAAWLIDAGRKVNQELIKNEIDWTPSDVDPPGITLDLLEMYDRAVRIQSDHGVVSASDLRDALVKVGRTACELARDWPVDDQRYRAEEPFLSQIEEFGRSNSKILTAIGIVAAVAQALTIFDAAADFGAATVDVFNGLSFLAQAIGDEVYNVARDTVPQLEQPFSRFDKSDPGDRSRQAPETVPQHPGPPANPRRIPEASNPWADAEIADPSPSKQRSPYADKIWPAAPPPTDRTRRPSRSPYSERRSGLDRPRSQTQSPFPDETPSPDDRDHDGRGMGALRS